MIPFSLADFIALLLYCFVLSFCPVILCYIYLVVGSII